MGRVLLLGRLLLVCWGLLSPIFELLLLLRLTGGIEGWRALEMIGVCHHWLALTFKLLLRLGGFEGWRTLEIIGVWHHWLALTFKLLLQLGGIEGWRALETIRETFKLLLWCNNSIPMGHGVCCANFSSPRGGWKQCRGAWCGNCHVLTTWDKHTIKVLVKEDGTIVVRHLWDKNKFLSARNGDHLM